jgi:hypothetical protein
LKKLSTETALLAASVQYRPDTPVSLFSHFRAAALCNFPVDDKFRNALNAF